ncbi:MAG: hypothetical protein IIC61_06940 [Proteobacteria bacterium]|nr:hypothetical protein [Pseudomonadota bacterium]
MLAKMPLNPESIKKTAAKESALFLCLVFFGLVMLPFAVYMVGKSVFGEYGGAGLSAFYGTLHSAMWDGEPAVLLLVLSPYVIWQLTRLTIWGFRQTRWRRQALT